MWEREVEREDFGGVWGDLEVVWRWISGEGRREERGGYGGRERERLGFDEEEGEEEERGPDLFLLHRVSGTGPAMRGDRSSEPLVGSVLPIRGTGPEGFSSVFFFFFSSLYLLFFSFLFFLFYFSSLFESSSVVGMWEGQWWCRLGVHG